MDEYVGCKLELNREEGWIKFTRPVLLQSFMMDELHLPENLVPTTPTKDGQILVPCKPVDGVPNVQQGKFRTGVGKLLHMM
jgi:hypothetical protein